MILALLFLPLLMLVYTLGPSTLLLVIAGALTCQYAIGYAYTDCVKSWNLLAFEEDGGNPAKLSRNALQRRHRRSYSPPPDLETISEQDQCSQCSEEQPAAVPETKSAQYPKAIPTHLRAENALLSRRRVRFACPRECINTY